MLVDWYRARRRPLPWRRDRDPYRVWVAEILLQQTRVDQAIPYYHRFVARFPTVGALARAPLADVLRCWQGAGYYARARHLHAAARQLVTHLGGRLPRDPEELETLPGIGPYVARAVAAIAFGAPVVALEANGVRVAARWSRESGRVTRPVVRARLGRTLAAALPPEAPGDFNEAVMELGETVCFPTHPDCPRCPVAVHCRAFRETRDPGQYPHRIPRPPRPHVRGALVVLRDGRRWFVQRRAPTALLGGLWEFPGGKIAPGEAPEAAARRELREETGWRAGPLRFRGVVHHAYSHFSVELHVYEGSLLRPSRRAPTRGKRWVTPDQLKRLPIPKATEKVLALLERSSGPAPGVGPGRSGSPARRNPPRDRPSTTVQGVG
jgi:A/G-specific adenine glycosylase